MTNAEKPGRHSLKLLLAALRSGLKVTIGQSASLVLLFPQKACDVTLKIEILGWAGTALVVIAYVPQIRHLYVEKCAWGISISTWLIWLIAGALLLSYCIFRNDTLFTLVQVINMTAIVVTIILARRSNQVCPYHFETAVAASVNLQTSPMGMAKMVNGANLKSLCPNQVMRR